MVKMQPECLLCPPWSFLQVTFYKSYNERFFWIHLQGAVVLKLGENGGAQSGQVFREKSGTPHVATASSTQRTPMTLTPSPAFTCNDNSQNKMLNSNQQGCCCFSTAGPTMSMMLTCPYANTTALGGLDTGSRKEKDVHSVVGMRMYNGLTWMASA